VTLTLDLQNLIRSSVGANEYFVSVLTKLFKPFMSYRGNNIRLDQLTNERTGQPKNIMSSPILLSSKSIKIVF